MSFEEQPSGSIFVCFICEREFKDITSLNDHMNFHDDVPEMEDVITPKRKGKKKRVTEDTLFPTRKNSRLSPILPSRPEEDIRGSFTTVEKAIFSFAKDDRENGTVQIKQKEPAKLLENQKPLKKESDTARTEVNPVSLAEKRAQNLRKYIMFRESKSSNKATHDDTNETTNEELGSNSGVHITGGNGMDHLLTGPIVLCSEPTGMVCPSSTKAFKNRKKVEWNYQDISSHFLKMAETEELEDKKRIEIMKDNYNKAKDTLRQNENKKLNLEYTSKVKRGRGRPRKVRDEDDDDEPDYHMSSLKAQLTADPAPPRKRGRRSQPRRASSDEEETYQCLECLKEFRSLSTMRVHMKSHTIDKEIPCPYCDEVFPQRHILYEHLVNYHEESSQLTCPVCYKVFTRPDSLKTHMVRMHEENGGLTCFVCNKNFPSQAQLETHVRVHTGERPYKCEICDKGFVQKVHLKTHLRTMHGSDSANTTPCRVCDKMLTDRNALRDHHFTVHRLTVQEYKNHVAKLRKEGRIPEALPPKVKVVDPSFRYTKVDVTSMHPELALNRSLTDSSEQATLRQLQETQLSTVKPSNLQSRMFHTFQGDPMGKSKSCESSPMTTTIFGRNGARKVRLKTSVDRHRAPGMGMVMDMMEQFEPLAFDETSVRDQEELNLVESAFKVAEQMDLENSSAVIVSDSSSSQILYSIPVAMESTTTSEDCTDVTTLAHASQPMTLSNSTCIMSIGDTVSAITSQEEEDDEEYAKFTMEFSVDDKEKGRESPKEIIGLLSDVMPDDDPEIP